MSQLLGQQEDEATKDTRSGIKPQALSTQVIQARCPSSSVSVAQGGSKQGMTMTRLSISQKQKQVYPDAHTIQQRHSTLSWNDCLHSLTASRALFGDKHG